MEAILFDRESCSGAELIGQSVLNKAPAIAASPRRTVRLGDVDPAFLSIDEDPGRTVLLFHAPQNVKVAVSLPQRPMFRGVGR
jgi:hypothetical protein